MKISTLIIAVSILTTGTMTQAFGASTRYLTCKGVSTTKGFEEFRINVLKTEANQYKATLSEGFTTMNTLETWQVNVAESNSKIVITNINKTPLKLTVLKNEQASVDSIYGLKASTNLRVVIAPFNSPKVNYTIDGQLACTKEK